MALDFLVVSGERSGSTWVANWLTTDRSICYHDPRLRWTEDQISRLKCGKKQVGVCCTFAGMDPTWANRQRCPTLVLHRDPAEIDASWGSLGVVPFVRKPVLENLVGWHVKWDAPRDPVIAKEIYEFLLLDTFDASRHQELVQMNVQPHFPGLTVGGGVKELTKKISEVLNS
jgi:hypothetical protein